MDVEDLRSADFDLSRLVGVQRGDPAIAVVRAQNEDKVADYNVRYGDDWFRHYVEDTSGCDCDSDLEAINGCIWYGSMIMVSGTTERVRTLPDMQRARMRELFGDRYDELVKHKPNDPRVNEILVADALATGKWKELPPCLQEEYHRRVAGGHVS